MIMMSYYIVPELAKYCHETELVYWLTLSLSLSVQTSNLTSSLKLTPLCGHAYAWKPF